MPKTLVAVEITEDSVRAAEVTAGRTPTVLAAGEVPLPEGAAKDSEVHDREAVSLALTQLWGEAGISNRSAVVGVASRRILVREHSTPLRNPAQIRQALPFQVQDLLPVPVEQAALDFYPASDDGEQIHGLLVAAVAESVEEIIATLSHAKIRTDAVDLTAFALARVLGVIAPAGRTALLIHIGEHTTQLVVAVDGVPQFVRVIPIDITPSDAADPLSTTVGAAGPDSRGARRRARIAGQSTGSTELPLTPTQQAALVDLAGRLRSTLSFYLAREGGRPVEVAWVSGAGSRYVRMREVLARIIGVEVTPLTALDIAATKKPIDDALAARLLPTVALTIGGTR